MDIFIDENIPFLAEALRNSEEHGFTLKRFSGRSLTREALQNCLALCVRSTTRVDADLVQHTSVRFVGTATSGSEHIDLDFCANRVFFFVMREAATQIPLRNMSFLRCCFGQSSVVL